METLGDTYPQEQARCRELLAQYRAIGPNGFFGYAIISDLLQRADRAAIAQDLPAMLRCYEEMKACE